MKPLDLTGQRYGKLVAIERLDVPSIRGQTSWRFACDCGGERRSTIGDVRSGRARSCGCLAAEVHSARLMRHGHKIGGRSTKTYNTWVGMVARCTDANQPSYPGYGGRGISVCPEWRNSFTQFLADMGDSPGPKMSIDRIDVNGNYEPGNCRWATLAEQNNNRRNTVWIELGSERLTLSDFAKREGLRLQSLWRRIVECGEDPAAAALAIRTSRKTCVGGAHATLTSARAPAS